MSMIPFVGLYAQLSRAFSTLQIENMKCVPHEDNDFNNDYSVDPLSDPRLDKLDLYGMVDPSDRDKIMNSTPSFDIGMSDVLGDDSALSSPSEASSASGSGE